jgi:hypothetical protein
VELKLRTEREGEEEKDRVNEQNSGDELVEFNTHIKRSVATTLLQNAKREKKTSTKNKRSMTRKMTIFERTKQLSPDLIGVGDPNFDSVGVLVDLQEKFFAFALLLVGRGRGYALLCLQSE